jgi:Uncharacterised nucleotidyltransferase
MAGARAVGAGEPRPAALQAALIKVTEVLARELVYPNPTPPEWSDFEWTVAQAVAAMHGVSPLLSSVLRWQGPRRWVDFLREQRAHVADRHARIVELLTRIDQLARAEGVAVVALKGVALHAIGLYEEGERPMADVDLLVRPQDIQHAVALIESLGYYEYRTSWKERAFAPRDGHPAGRLGEHSGNDISIELHQRICERLPLHTTDITANVFPGQPRAGLNPYPSRASLMVHLLLHAAGSMAFQSLRLLQLHDLALLAMRMTAADWDELVDCRSGQRGLWWALPPLQLVSRYYSLRIPERILGHLKSGCPWLLHQAVQRRTLSDVSFSHLWVDAFPGIEWSQSVREMLSYARSRMHPDREHLALRDTITNTQPWAASSQWSTLSQTRRILRWLVRRQTRPATMHVVRAALAQAQ